MNCRRVQRYLNAFLAGQLPDRPASRIELHLTRCPACSAERDELVKLNAVLQNLSATAEVYPGFENRVWAGIRAAECEQPAAQWWQRPAWVLSTATVAATLMFATATWATRERNEATAQQQFFAATGLDQLGNLPSGLLSPDYLRIALK